MLNNVATGPLFRGQRKAEAYEHARDWIARVGLSGFENHYPHQLSGGMRKRVALAQTFINEPQILLMDEPFSALDVQTRTMMEDELLNMWSSISASVIFVTHDLEEAISRLIAYASSHPAPAPSRVSIPSICHVRVT